MCRWCGRVEGGCHGASPRVSVGRRTCAEGGVVSTGGKLLDRWPRRRQRRTPHHRRHEGEEPDRRPPVPQLQRRRASATSCLISASNSRTGLSSNWRHWMDYWTNYGSTIQTVLQNLRAIPSKRHCDGITKRHPESNFAVSITNDTKLKLRRSARVRAGRNRNFERKITLSNLFGGR